MFRKEDTSTETRVALYHPTNGVDVHSLVILQRQIPTSVVKTTLRTRHHSRMSTLASAPSLKIFLIAFLLMVNTVYSFRMGTVSRLSIQLHAVKSSSSDKIRVKLLADVKGTGRKGDILFISPAMWTNVMAPKKLAQKLSDEEVANTAALQAAGLSAELAKARVLQDKIMTMDRFVIVRKVGVGKNLFGSVSQKQLLEMLKERFPENITGPTSVIITDMKVCDDDNECPLETDGDIRQTGTYKCIVKLHAKVDASFIFDVIAEVKA